MIPPGHVSGVPAAGLAAHQSNVPGAGPAGGDADATIGFADLVDIVNPLQHIPVINSIYQDMTGDTIKPVMSIAGGALFGGPIGAAIALVSTVIKAGLENPAGETAGEALAMDPVNPAVTGGVVVDDGAHEWNTYQKALVSLGVPAGRIDGLRPGDINRAIERTYTALDNDGNTPSGTPGAVDEEKRLFAARIRDSV
ncbi:MAG: hypothetical protein R3318_05645 [Gammaproteobacteria bacterium]|nr:hypothetical protein [Gammaproteobacteria bacterium]